MAHLIGYARVSTTAQRLDLQTDELARAGCAKIYTDTASGSTTSRPQLDDALDRLLAGDTLVVWRLDRLGRSLRHLLDLVADLDDRGVGLRSITEGIDTTTANGRLVFSIFGAVAEFERDLLRERTAAGVEAARERGRVGGRPPAITPEQLDHARRLLASEPEPTVAAVARTLGVKRPTLVRHLALT